MTPASSPVEALHARGIHVSLGGLPILRGIDLAVRPGQVVGVLGPSGAGKSTLFRALAGDLATSEGQVLLREQDVSRLPLWARARAGLGYVPQSPSVLWDLTVARNLQTFERLTGALHVPAGARARPLGLDHRLGTRARDLSGGERRRLEILRALVAQPSVLICDEPFAGVDPARASDVGRVLRAHADGGAAVLVADHRVPEALSVCDRALLLVDGEVIVDVPSAEFADHPAVREHYLG